MITAYKCVFCLKTQPAAQYLGYRFFDKDAYIQIN